MKQNCSRCSNPKSSSHGFCNSCHAKYMRNWRKTHPLTEHQRKIDRCHALSRYYVKTGRIIKYSCHICKNPNSQMHHPDYNQHLLVEWYCRKHHLELHKKIAQSVL